MKLKTNLPSVRGRLPNIFFTAGIFPGLVLSLEKGIFHIKIFLKRDIFCKRGRFNKINYSFLVIFLPHYEMYWYLRAREKNYMFPWNVVLTGVNGV